MEKQKLQNATIIREAKINTNSQLHFNVLFDLYLKDDEREEFVEVKNSVPPFTLVNNQLMLVSYYNKINHCKAKYVLIIAKRDNKISEIDRKKIGTFEGNI